ncbi:MAG: hypothetical protein RL077_656, partial [Verrucomicrobiota bacterium]
PARKSAALIFTSAFLTTTLFALPRVPARVAPPFRWHARLSGKIKVRIFWTLAITPAQEFRKRAIYREYFPRAARHPCLDSHSPAALPPNPRSSRFVARHKQIKPMTGPGTIGRPAGSAKLRPRVTARTGASRDARIKSHRTARCRRDRLAYSGKGRPFVSGANQITTRPSA